MIERGKLYTLEQIKQIAKVSERTISDLEKSGLMTLRATPQGAKSISGEDWIDFLRQIAISENRKNEFDRELWLQLQEARKQERQQKRERERIAKERKKKRE